MGSLVSPIVANLYMEHFERETLQSASNPQVLVSLSFAVYHKPTHTDQYVQWDSHHNLSAKYSVIGTLTHRAKQFVLNQSYSRRNYHTLGKPWLNANTHPGQ